ncbi:MAG TPA: glycosyltransferase [Spirochaetota bacterium]|nr:glycosyltransferase [Spirochaetota bacterium]
MIFVVTGTEAFPFNRLIKKIDSMKKNGTIEDDVFIQLGSCDYTPTECRWEKWLPFDRMVDNIRISNHVITHAGAGTTLLCLDLGKKPILVTRRKIWGEHVDDHQVEFAELMDRLEYASVAYDVSELPGIYNITKTSHKGKNVKHREKEKLITVLNDWIKS